uniref:Uncharacterized protein n=1 Tax=Rhizophora mucronata TaxID=61149 RepID=A0A2P2IK99_RHIMU
MLLLRFVDGDIRTIVNYSLTLYAANMLGKKHHRENSLLLRFLNSGIRTIVTY